MLFFYILFNMFKNVFGSPYIDAFPSAVRSISNFSKLTFFNVSNFLSTIISNSSQKDNITIK